MFGASGGAAGIDPRVRVVGGTEEAWETLTAEFEPSGSSGPRSGLLGLSASTNRHEIICPQCHGQFVCEMEITRPRMVVDFTAFDASPEARWLEALSLLMDPPIRLFDTGIDPTLPHETPARPGLDPRSFFFGPGLNELIEKLTQNDRPGLPLAPESTINAIPTVFRNYIYSMIRNVQFVRRNSRSVERQGSCLATIYTTMIASCLG
ncbi:hypothetical protein F3Y22_tig00110895pilonHSYRG00346 [Hibiscus syriacus]|uniref:RING/U-box superfamily protein n=1 Tax=Hibiscus syriacus TaxID=106335 RepID=A0A6A2ZFS5_HIBSY|nr:hypothetical protein F3Y22_tig00110895pilonHSYRG00346 [Hibiscus syriacus]